VYGGTGNAKVTGEGDRGCNTRVRAHGQALAAAGCVAVGGAAGAAHGLAAAALARSSAQRTTTPHLATGATLHTHNTQVFPISEVLQPCCKSMSRTLGGADGLAAKAPKGSIQEKAYSFLASKVEVRAWSVRRALARGRQPAAEQLAPNDGLADEHPPIPPRPTQPSAVMPCAHAVPHAPTTGRRRRHDLHHALCRGVGAV
jgi:hypothetical protein